MEARGKQTNFYDNKLSADEWRWFFGVSNTEETSDNRNRSSNGPMPRPKGWQKATVLPAGLANTPHLLISSAPMWNSRSVDVRPRTTPFTERLQGSDTNCTR